MASSPQLKPRVLQFGHFEFDVRAGELRKHGIRIKLREQPIQILEMLVANPGEVVLREEIRLRLWPNNTTVGFDQAINAGILRLRGALGESAERPHYIETVARRGYRFTGQVQCVASQTPADVPAAQDTRPSLDCVSVQEIPPAMSAPAKPIRRWLLAFALAVLLLIAGTWILGQAGHTSGPPPRLLSLSSYPGMEFYPSFSPDGRQVAFTWNGPKNDNWDLYVKLVGETNPLRITNDPASDDWPAWSPDGKWIAFERSAPGRKTAVHIVSPLGGAERTIAEFPATGPISWSPDGKWLAVSRTRSPEASERDPGGIFLLQVDGGEPRQLTNPVAPQNGTDPAFSPAGRSLAYATCPRRFACDIFVQDLSPDLRPLGLPRRITNQQLSMWGIVWTADSLIYSGSMSTGMLPYLWRVPLNGSHPPERLEIAGVNAFEPSITRTGNRLAFTRASRNYDIWTYQVGGGSPKLLIASSLDDLSPQFSPDGSKIVFTSARSGESYDLWIVNADGSNPVSLTSQIGRGDGSPRWSPDGRQIVYDSQRADGSEEICVIDASGGRPRHLTQDSFQNTIPSWSRDGRWIYFNSDRSGKRDLWRMPSSGGPATRLTDNGGFTAFESVDGKTLYYTKAMKTPLYAKSLSGGIERQVVDLVGSSRDFAVFDDGIYYGGLSEKGQTPIYFYQFSSGKSRLVTRFEGSVYQGLAVSPDRKTILFSTNTAAGADLMLIENFR